MKKKNKNENKNIKKNIHKLSFEYTEPIYTPKKLLYILIRIYIYIFKIIIIFASFK